MLNLHGMIDILADSFEVWRTSMSRKKKKTWRIRLILAALIVLPFIIPRVLDLFDSDDTEPGKVRITISRETTFIDGPINSDGTISYVAYLNETCSQGVTPQNNAAGLLIRAVGPYRFEDASENIIKKTLKILGIDSLPKDGEYFVKFDAYLKANYTPNPKPATTSQPRRGRPSRSLPYETDEELRKIHENTLKKMHRKNYMLQAGENFSKAMHRPWTEAQFPIVAKWLKANDKPISLAFEASRRPRFYYPWLCDNDPPEVIMAHGPPLGFFRKIGKVLVIRGMLKLGRQDVDGAWSDLQASHRLARLVVQYPVVVAGLAATAIEETACRGDSAVAIHAKLSTEQARKFLADLQALPSMPDLKKCFDLGERMMYLDVVMQLARCFIKNELEGDFENVDTSYGQLDWDMMLKNVNWWWDRSAALQGNLSETERQKIEEELDKDFKEFEERREQFRGTGFKTKLIFARLLATKRVKRKMLSEAVWNLLQHITMPALTRARLLHKAALMSGELSQVAFSLADYKAQNGGYPKKLSQLAPKYIKQIPPDRFSKKDLIYKPGPKGKSYLLYSTGENGLDDGGKENEYGTSTDYDDIVVETNDKKQ